MAPVSNLMSFLTKALRFENPGTSPNFGPAEGVGSGGGLALVLSLDLA